MAIGEFNASRLDNTHPATAYPQVSEQDASHLPPDLPFDEASAPKAASPD